MFNLQRSLFYDVKALIQTSSFYRKYYLLFQSLDLTGLHDKNLSVGCTGYSRHAFVRALIVKHLESIKSIPKLLKFLDAHPVLTEMCGFNPTCLPDDTQFYRFLYQINTSEIEKQHFNINKKLIDKKVITLTHLIIDSKPVMAATKQNNLKNPKRNTRNKKKKPKRNPAATLGYYSYQAISGKKDNYMFFWGYRTHVIVSKEGIPLVSATLPNNQTDAKVAKKLGSNLYKHFLRLGFGSKTGICFPGERAGFVNDPKNWSRSSIIVLSFGYEIAVTILQLAKAFSIIANNGIDVLPALVLNPIKTNLNTKPQKLYRKEVVNQLKSIIELRGWMKERYSINGFKIFGKTGTARVIKEGEYSAKDHVYTYAGIIEKGDYKRVIVTFLREPLHQDKNVWASQLTLPLFYKIAKKMIVYDLQHGILKS